MVAYSPTAISTNDNFSYQIQLNPYDTPLTVPAGTVNNILNPYTNDDLRTYLDAFTYLAINGIRISYMPAPNM